MDTWLPTRALAAAAKGSLDTTLSKFCHTYIGQVVNNDTRTDEICIDLNLDHSLYNVSILALASKKNDTMKELVALKILDLDEIDNLYDT